MKRFLIFAIALAIAWYLAKNFGLLPSSNGPVGSPTAPIERARAAAAAADARTSAGQGIAREADQPVNAGTVTENMTPDQVRALIGSPDDVSTETTATGGPREVWTYRSVGKTVIFENGVVAGVR
jgi:hypothetical protein